MIHESEDLPRQRTPNLGQSFIAVADNQALQHQQPPLVPPAQQNTPYHPEQQQQHHPHQEPQIPQQLRLATNRPQRTPSQQQGALPPPQDNIPHTSTTTVNSRPVSSIEPPDQPPPLVPIAPSQRQNPAYTEQNYNKQALPPQAPAANGSDGSHPRPPPNSYAAAPPRRISRKEGVQVDHGSMASLPPPSRTQSGSTERPPATVGRNISTDRGSHRSLSTGSRGGGPPSSSHSHDRYTSETERSLRRANAYAAEPSSRQQISAPSSPIHFGASSENNPTYSHQNVRYVPNTRPKE